MPPLLWISAMRLTLHRNRNGIRYLEQPTARATRVRLREKPCEFTPVSIVQAISTYFPIPKKQKPVLGSFAFFRGPLDVLPCMVNLTKSQEAQTIIAVVKVLQLERR